MLEGTWSSIYINEWAHRLQRYCSLVKPIVSHGFCDDPTVFKHCDRCKQRTNADDLELLKVQC